MFKHISRDEQFYFNKLFDNSFCLFRRIVLIDKVYLHIHTQQITICSKFNLCSSEHRLRKQLFPSAAVILLEKMFEKAIHSTIRDIDLRYFTEISLLLLTLVVIEIKYTLMYMKLKQSLYDYYLMSLQLQSTNQSPCLYY